MRTFSRTKLSVTENDKSQQFGVGHSFCRLYSLLRSTTKQRDGPLRSGRSSLEFPVLEHCTMRVVRRSATLYCAWKRKQRRQPHTGPRGKVTLGLVYGGIYLHLYLHLHLSLNREGRRGTTDDFTTSFLHFSLFSTAP